MRRHRRNVAQFMTALFFIGWFSYWGWTNPWYSNTPEQYAYPASLSSPKDPPWGFWYW